MRFVVAPEQVPISTPGSHLNLPLLNPVPAYQLPHPLAVLILQALSQLQSNRVSSVSIDGPNLTLQLSTQTIMPDIVFAAGAWARW
jgi:hypothetical protein